MSDIGRLEDLVYDQQTGLMYNTKTKQWQAPYNPDDSVGQYTKDFWRQQMREAMPSLPAKPNIGNAPGIGGTRPVAEGPGYMQTSSMQLGDPQAAALMRQYYLQNL